MYLQYSHPPSPSAKCLQASYSISESIFVDVPYRLPCGMDKLIPSVVPGPSQWFFYFGKEIIITCTQVKTTTLGGTEPHHSSWHARSHTAAVTDNLRRWQWEILEHPPYSPDMSPCDYDFFVKVKEPLLGTRYNTRDELSVLYDSQYTSSTKMDALMMYNTFQTFGKRW